MYIENKTFHTVYGRGLVKGLAETAPRPYLVVTMEDLWPLVKQDLSTDLADVYFVTTVDMEGLDQDVRDLPQAASIIGVGGGRAMDVAKWFTWRRNLPLFQLPTSMSVNAAWAHRSGVRTRGGVHYIGWAVPEVVYVDYDIVQSAPPHINCAGVGDIFCIHTAHFDWRLATKHGKAGLWPWDDDLAAQCQAVLQRARSKTAAIRAVSEEGIHVVMETHRWTSGIYYSSGWNARCIEGAEHFFFYALEHLTGRAFVHGEPVCLGIIFMSHLQDNDPEGIWRSIEEVGVRIRPEEMGVTWADVREALRMVRAYAEKENLFYTVVNEREVDDKLFEMIRRRLS